MTSQLTAAFDYQPETFDTDAEYTLKANADVWVQVCNARAYFVHKWDEAEEAVHHLGEYRTLAAALAAAQAAA